MANADDKSGLRANDCHQGGLAKLAAAQAGVVSREQLHARGFSNDRIRRLVREGWLHRLYHNVFAVGHQRVTERARLLAALLTMGPRSFLSHRTATAVRGLRAMNLYAIEVTVPGTGGRGRDGLIVHRTDAEPHPDEVRTHFGLRVSSVPRLLVEVAARETPAELERLVTVAVRKRLLRLDTRDGLASLEATLQRHPRFPGIKKLTGVLAAYRRTEDHKSQLEAAFDRWLALHPEIPEPQRNIHLGIWEIDRYWREHRLAVELDGRPYHIAVKDMERDRIKDAKLQKLDVTPLRVTDFRFAYDRPSILEDLEHFLKKPK